jgi:hypothetical protein
MLIVFCSFPSKSFDSSLTLLLKGLALPHLSHRFSIMHVTPFVLTTAHLDLTAAAASLLMHCPCRPSRLFVQEDFSGPANVAAALANCWLKPKLQPAAI